jgi:hypothetical protein
VDEAHGGLASVDDGNAFEHVISSSIIWGHSTMNVPFRMGYGRVT